MNKTVLKKSAWGKEDIKNWIKEHAGEYLMKRVEVKEMMNLPMHREATAKALEHAEKTLREQNRNESGEWLVERQVAAYFIMPKDERDNAADSDMLYAVIEIEKEMEELIEKIQALKAND